MVVKEATVDMKTGEQAIIYPTPDSLDTIHHLREVLPRVRITAVDTDVVVVSAGIMAQSPQQTNNNLVVCQPDCPLRWYQPNNNYNDPQSSETIRKLELLFFVWF